MVFAGFWTMLQEKVGKVPFNLSLHVPPARWYPLAAQSGIAWGLIYGRVLYRVLYSLG